MSVFDKLKNKFIIITVYIIVISINIFHFVSAFFIEETDLGYIFDEFEASPLFNFSLNTSCNSKSHNIFHVWEGKIKKKIVPDEDTIIGVETEIVDKTNIEKINGYLFCYDHISYKKLLYNGQIIKKEEKCEDEFPKDCGIIDTLEQHLCIKIEENCPLYDVGIGQQNISENDIYDKGELESDIYYNNEKYNKSNRKIIGRLILNDGQPCYKSIEKLWRKFDSDEAGEEHLKCETEIYGKLTDGRYEKKGDISYKKIYEDNLGKNYKLVRDDLKGTEKVSLFKRTFLGINKTCDENIYITRDQSEKFKKNVTNESDCLFGEFINFILFLITFIIMISIDSCKEGKLKIRYIVLFVVLFLYLFFSLVFIILQSVYLGKMIKNEIAYNCSDALTNKLLSKDNENMKASIVFTVINLGIDVFIILLCGLILLIVFIIKKCEDYKTFHLNKKNSNETQETIAQNINKTDEVYNTPLEKGIENKEAIPQMKQLDKPLDNINQIPISDLNILSPNFPNNSLDKKDNK